METTTNNTTGKDAGWQAAIATSAQVEMEKKQAGKPPRSFAEKMPCTLTAEELAERGAQMGDALAEVEKLDTERKSTNDGFKARIELVEGRIRELGATLRSKTEMREVELLEEFIFATNTVRVYRADDPDKKSVRERAMTKNERQVELPIEKESKKSAAAKPAKDATAIVEPQKVLDGVAENDGDEKGKGKGKKKTGRKQS